MIPPGLNVLSTEPSGFNRARWRLVTPLTIWKSPPMITLKSFCTATARTGPSGPAPGSKVVSSEPSKLSRAMKLRFVPLARVNRPPSTTRPLFCTTTELTKLFTPRPTLKFVSAEPSWLSRAMFVRPKLPTVVKRPPMTTLPEFTPLV